MMDRVTLLYSPACPVCDECARDLLPVATEANINVVVRQPLPSEKQYPGFRTPALFIPEGQFGCEQPHLIVGGALIDWLEEKLDGLNNSDR